MLGSAVRDAPLFPTDLLLICVYFSTTSSTGQHNVLFSWPLPDNDQTYIFVSFWFCMSLFDQALEDTEYLPTGRVDIFI